MENGLTVLGVVGDVPSNVNTARHQHFRAIAEHFDTYILSRGSVAPSIREKAGGVRSFPEDSNLGFFPWSMRKGINLLRKRRFDLVFTARLPQVVLTGFCLRTFFQLPWVVDVWDDPLLGLQFPSRSNGFVSAVKEFVKPAVRRGTVNLINRADHILLGLDQKFLEEVGWNETKVTTVTNGFNFEDRPSADESNSGVGEQGEGFVVLRLGSARPKGRGMNVVLDAVKRVDESGVPIRFEHIGKDEGEERLWLENAIQERGIGELVRLEGPVPHHEVLGKILRSDVCLCTLSSAVRNYKYAYPVKLFEYMSAGKAIIGSNLPGIASIIEHGKNGLLAEPDDANELSEMIVRLWENPTLRARLGRRAGEDVKEYSWESIRTQIGRAVRGVVQTT